jgi:hypothetical protein
MPQFNFSAGPATTILENPETFGTREGRDCVPALQKQGRRAAMGSLLCADLEEELKRLSLWDHINARETPAKEKSKPGGVFCQGVSPWDEPCMIVATKHCERCSRWFCETHFRDPDWHSCTEEEQ